MRARVVVVLMFLLVAGLVQPVMANDFWRILGGVAAGILTSETYKLSDSEIAQLGDQAVQDVEGEHEAYADPRVSRIGGKLAEAAKLPGVQFRVLRDQEKNAFAIPTRPGRVYITSGYLGTRLTDDQLSFVLGHELGHLSRGHASQNLRRSGERRGVIVGLLVATGANETWQEVGSGIDFFAGNHYSQKQELEADEFGYRLTAAIGRNPSAGLAAFDKLRDGSEPPRWLNSLFNTHPLLSDRQRRLAMQQNLHEQPAARQANDPNQSQRIVYVDFHGDIPPGFEGKVEVWTERSGKVRIVPRPGGEDYEEISQAKRTILESGEYDTSLPSTPRQGKMVPPAERFRIDVVREERPIYGAVSLPVGREGNVEVGDYVKVKVTMIVRPRNLTTGELMDNGGYVVSGSAEGLRTVAVYVPGSSVIVGGVHLGNYEETLEGRAAEQAIRRFIDQLPTSRPAPTTATVTIRLWEDKRMTSPATGKVKLITSRGQQILEVRGQATVEVEPGMIRLEVKRRSGFTGNNPGWEMPKAQKPEVVARAGQVVIWDLYKVSR
jgi:putative metalloprotease